MQDRPPPLNVILVKERYISLFRMIVEVEETAYKFE